VSFAWVRPDTLAFAVRLNDNFVSAIGLAFGHKCPTRGAQKRFARVHASLTFGSALSSHSLARAENMRANGLTELQTLLRYRVFSRGGLFACV
jgi:hypothetical protein